jgi:two-component system sensor histidine kinase VicK
MKGIRFFQSIQVKLIIIYVLLILIAMQLIGIYFVRTMESSFLNNFSSSLNRQVNLLTEFVKPYLLSRQEGNQEDGEDVFDDLSDVVNNFNRISGAEIQIIDSNAFVLSASLNDSIVEKKTTQPEITRALQGIKSNENVIDSVTGVRKRSIVMPVWDDSRVIGAVYIVASMQELFDTINRINQIFAVGTLIALALTAMLGILLSNTITNPIKEITKKATAMAEGNFNQEVEVFGHDEIGQLGIAFNYMTNRLKEALSSNEEEKEKLGSILSNMSDGVVATDDMGKIIVMNRRAKQMLQIQEDDAMGIEIADLLGMTKENIGKYVMGEDNIAMIDLKLPDEEDLLKIRVTFTPIHRRGRGVTGTIIVLQDVTEQEKLEQSRKEFVANVSHELRTPLTSIKSYLEALDDGAIDDPQLSRRFVGVTRNETERMIRLVTDLLHLSRLDSKQAIISKEPTNVYNMLEDVADRFSFQLKQRSIEITISAQKGIHQVSLDPDQIDQVLDNLVSNAIKYTPDGGVIEISVRKLNEEWIEISVEDTGIGIPKKDLNRIFERFYRVDKARSRSAGGTGLGLSIAREIVRAHGGAISLMSDVNQGTKVSFTLPAAAEGSETA